MNYNMKREDQLQTTIYSVEPYPGICPSFSLLNLKLTVL